MKLDDRQRLLNRLEKTDNCSCIVCIHAIHGIISKWHSRRLAAAEGLNDERGQRFAMNQVIASDSLRERAVAMPQDESLIGAQSKLDSIQPKANLQAVLDRANLQRALKQVRRNKGAPGIDGMTVDELPQYLKQHWPAIREQLETGRYRPQPVRRVEIPKPL